MRKQILASVSIKIPFLFLRGKEKDSASVASNFSVLFVQKKIKVLRVEQILFFGW